MNKTITLLTIATLGVLAIPAQAHQKPPELNRFDRIEQRLNKQQYRTHEGIDRGELTRKEARSLRKQQHVIMRLTYKFMHDGYLDRYEFRELKHELNRASKRIYRLKHNNHNRHARSYYY